MNSSTSTKTVIIDYGSGNLRSAAKAFEEVSDGEVLVSSNPADLAEATHIVLPGVGAFGDCAAGLRVIDGMVPAMEEQVLQNKKPFLGICVGMQLLAEKGYEHGEHDGLGWIPGKVVKIEPADPKFPVPHMGWNSLEIVDGLTENQLLQDTIYGDVYFVHSYQFECEDEFKIATTDYCGAVTAVVARNNIFGVQFHPEKSQKAGLRIIKNFLST